MATPKVRLPFDGNQRLTQGFGERPEVYKDLDLPGHNGIDWGVVVGTPILAVDSGKVILRKDDPTGFGLHIKLQHSWGQSLYAHLSQFKAELNQSVKVGAVVGLSGNTGFSSGPHLHFGMRVEPYSQTDGWNGYTNPQRFLDWPDAGTPTDSTELEQRLAEAKQALAEFENSYTFERQELTQQADLWQEAITDLVRQYMPGQMPGNIDVLTTLEALIQSWSTELEQLRREKIASFFAPRD